MESDLINCDGCGHKIHVSALSCPDCGKIKLDNPLGGEARTFSKAFKVCFSKYFVFKGRASRSEFWFWILANFLIILLFSIFAVTPITIVTTPLYAVWILAIIFPTISVSVRRMHDQNITGWIVLLFTIMNLFFLLLQAVSAYALADAVFNITLVIQLIFQIFVIYIFSRKGTVGPNRFG
jgi:uncharacterized membrane protein YhaH (DUF805 family)